MQTANQAPKLTVGSPRQFVGLGIGHHKRDIFIKYITPALEKAGWDKITQIFEEYLLTKGRIIVPWQKRVNHF